MAGRARARDGVDPRRARGHDRRRDREPADREGRARDQRVRGRRRRHVLHPRRCGRGARVRLPDRPARPQEAVPRQPRAVPGRDGPDRPDVERGVVLGLPLPDRPRHRRRVRRDQLRDRRADPRAGARLGRPGDQRLVLARGRVRRRALRRAAGHEPVRPRPRLAARVLPRRGAGDRDHVRPPPRAGEPALADDPRPQRRGRSSSSTRSRRTSSDGPARQLREPRDSIEIQQRESTGFIEIAQARSSRATRAAPSSASRCWPRRRSSTTP